MQANLKLKLKPKPKFNLSAASKLPTSHKARKY